MPRELISEKTRLEFREAFVRFWKVSHIEAEFKVVGVTPDRIYRPPESGQRRVLVEQLYRAMNFSRTADLRRLVRVYEALLHWLDREVAQRVEEENRRSSDVRAADIEELEQRKELLLWLKRDGFDVKDGHLVAAHGVAGASHLLALAEGDEASYLAAQIERLQVAIADEPDLAIGTAKELVETCCTSILNRLGKPTVDKPDITKLVASVMDGLDLLPRGVPDEKKGAAAIRKTLGSAAAIVQGIAELRNLYGTGHGKDGKWTGLGPRHARLAGNAAITLATFLFETADEKLS